MSRAAPYGPRETEEIMDFTPLTDFLKAQIRLGVPGCELIVCRRGEILYHECAGEASPEQRYLMYSCTKPVTVAAAMRLVERGTLRLEDPVSRYLPAFAGAYTLKDGARAPLSRPMTLWHLFTMTGGLNYDLRRPAVARLLARDPGASTVAVAQAMAEDPLDFESGGKFQYSLCHDVLAAVVEAATGQTFRSYVLSNVTGPLGMAHTDFWVPGETYENLAPLYSWTDERLRPASGLSDFVPSPYYYSGGAGLVSTAGDYIRFADELTRGEALLSRATVDLIRSEQIPRLRETRSFDCNCGPEYGYGLGVRTRVSLASGAPGNLGEFGWDGYAGADVLMDPASGLSFVYVQHVKNWPPKQGVTHVRVRDLLYPIVAGGGV